MVQLHEWERASPATHSSLAEISHSEAAAACERARTLNCGIQVTHVHDGLQITTTSFVGSIDLGPLALRVVPKIAPETTATLMRYALGLASIRRSESVETPVVERGFVDLVGLLLKDEVDAVLRAGVFCDYRPEERWLARPRGRVLFAALARDAAEDRFALPCRIQTRTADLALNRVMLAALSALRPMILDGALRFELHSREALLAGYCELRPLSHELLREAEVQADRRSAYYQPILTLAELILRASGPDLDESEEGPRSTLPGFLFDMNTVFERFITRLCREYAPRELRVAGQESVRRAFRYESNPYGWKVPRLRPDLVVYREMEPALVIDAKYKDLAQDRPTSTDLYQLTLYSMSFGTARPVPARLVYPASTIMTEEPKLAFGKLRAGDAMGRVSVFAFDLVGCVDALRRNDTHRLRGMIQRLCEH